MPQIIIDRPPKRSASTGKASGIESDKVLVIIKPYSLEVYTDDDAEIKSSELSSQVEIRLEND